MGLFGSDDKEIVTAARGDSITESRLFEKSARIVQRLNSKPIVEYLCEDEQPHYLFSGPMTGLTINTPDGEYSVSPDGQHHAFTVVTDRRLLCLAGHADGDRSVSVEYNQIKNVRLQASATKFKLWFGTDAGKCVFHSNKKMGEDEATEATEYIRSRIPEESSSVIEPTDLRATIENLKELEITERAAPKESKYIAEDSGSTVTPERIGTINEMLNDGEEVVHILRVPLMRHGPEAETKSMSTKHTKTGTAAFTSNRVVIKIPHQLSDDQFIIRYSDIENVSYNMEGVISASRGFEITTRGEKYRLGVHYKINDSEVREILDWLDEQTSEIQTDSTETEPTTSPSDRFEELDMMKEEGLVSQEEYDTKREEIIDDL